jgi:hypothetical protein
MLRRLKSLGIADILNAYGALPMVVELHDNTKTLYHT